MDQLSAPQVSRRSLVGLAALGVLGAGCSQRVGGYRYRIDFRLLVDGVLKQASTVRAVEYRRQSEWLLAGDGPFEYVQGSAVAIDISPDRSIILTLNAYRNWNGMRMSRFGDGERLWKDGGPWSIASLRMDRGQHASSLAADLNAAMAEASFHLQPHELPVMATFENPLDPATGRVIRPEELSVEFPNVRFGDTTVRITGERVTRSDIARRMPWLTEGEPYRTGHRSLPNRMFVT